MDMICKTDDNTKERFFILIAAFIAALMMIIALNRNTSHIETPAMQWKSDTSWVKSWNN